MKSYLYFALFALIGFTSCDKSDDGNFQFAGNREMQDPYLITLVPTCTSCPPPMANLIEEYTPLPFLINSDVKFLETDPDTALIQVFKSPVNVTNAEVDIDLFLATCKMDGETGAKLEIVTVTSGVPNTTDVIASATVPKEDIRGWTGCVRAEFGNTIFSFSNLSLNNGTEYALMLTNTVNTGHIYWHVNDPDPMKDGQNPYVDGSAWKYDLVNNINDELAQRDLDFAIHEIDHGSSSSVEEKIRVDFEMISGMDQEVEHSIIVAKNGVAPVYDTVWSADNQGTPLPNWFISCNQPSDIQIITQKGIAPCVLSFDIEYDGTSTYKVYSVEQQTFTGDNESKCGYGELESKIFN